MKYIKISIGIFFALAASRFIPHPPNFTSLLALSFYIPVLFGIKFLPILLLSFIITDVFIGFHGVVLFTWGTVILIGLMSKFFVSNIIKRISGALLGACLFYFITNFGVWSLGSYGYTFEGLILCYTLAIPFFTYSLISTFLFSGLIETISKLNIIKFINFKKI
tara:strand:- start:108 stop:599 length:492 start_codon:yes stop_codon:yes gene_type:complete